jgi:hypothetical protein
MIPSPELQAKIASWRAKAIDGTITQDEMREAIALMRQGRVGAAIASEKSAASRVVKAKAVVPSAEDMLKELGL